MNRDGRHYRCELRQRPGLRTIRVAIVMHEWVDAVEELVELYQIGLDLLDNALQM